MAWVIVGLGNPGNEYDNTRHNAGRMAVAYFAKKHDVSEWKIDAKSKATTAKVGTTICVLPDTFMNKSGSAVIKYVKSAKAAEKMIVVYDDLDLPIGKIKLSWDRGSGGHRGLESVMSGVKSRKFARIRIGVSPETAGGKLKKPQGEKEVNDFILHTFKPSEQDELKKVFKRVNEAIDAVMKDGALVAMNEYNQN